MTTSKTRFPLVLVLLRLGRVSNLPTVWSNVMAAAVLCGANLWAPTTAMMMLTASLLYVGGMFLNDACDAKIDALQRPDRPIPAGEISRFAVFAAASALLVAGIGIAATYGPRAFVAALTTVLAITVYNLWHKGNPAGPVIMGLCRVGVYCTTSVAITGGLPAAVLTGALLLLGYVLGLTYVAKYENSGGPRRLWPLAGLFAPVLYALPALGSAHLARMVVVGFCIWVYRAVVEVRRRNRSAVASLIAGISLLDAVLIAVHGSPIEALPAVLAFGLTLVFHRYVAGT